MISVIEIEHLRKQYASGFFRKRQTTVIDDLSLSVRTGTVTGLLGKNGAGKTTLIRCLLGLVKTDAGTCNLWGEPSWQASADTRRRIGFVPQTLQGHLWMNARQTLSYYADFYPDWKPDLADQLLELMGVPAHQPLNELSEGERQKVAIVTAVAHQPDLLVLDEPVASLDPSARRQFIDLILDLFTNEDKTVFFSTHITSDIERMAAEVALLQDGRIELHRELDTLKDTVCRLHIGRGSVAVIDRLPSVIRVEQHADSAVVTLNDCGPEMLSELARSGVQVQREPLNLEEIFLELHP